jgi:hypothetical protein
MGKIVRPCSHRAYDTCHERIENTRTHCAGLVFSLWEWLLSAYLDGEAGIRWWGDDDPPPIEPPALPWLFPGARSTSEELEALDRRAVALLEWDPAMSLQGRRFGRLPGFSAGDVAGLDHTAPRCGLRSLKPPSNCSNSPRTDRAPAGLQ